MKKIFDYVISFLLGGLTGGIIVGNVVTSDLKKRIDACEEQNQILTEEIISLKAKKKEVQQTVAKEPETKKPEKNSGEELRKRYISKTVVEDDEDDPIDIKIAKIKMISEDDYNVELSSKESEEMTYYQLDGTLVDSEHNVVINEETIIGSDAMDIIDDTTNDNIYVLNDAEDKVYNVTIEHDLSYMRDCLGIGE